MILMRIDVDFSSAIREQRFLDERGFAPPNFLTLSGQ